MAEKISAYEASEAELLQAPQIKSKVRIWPHQWPGLFVLVLIPVLALFGIFGESTKKITRSDGKLEASIEYPSKLRLGQKHSVRVTLTNKSDQALEDIVASFNSDYIHQFSEVSFVPDAKKAYQVEVGSLAPGESSSILVELTAEGYGFHNGKVSVSSAGTDLIAPELKTLVFP